MKDKMTISVVDVNYDSDTIAYIYTVVDIYNQAQFCIPYIDLYLAMKNNTVNVTNAVLNNENIVVLDNIGDQNISYNNFYQSLSKLTEGSSSNYKKFYDIASKLGFIVEANDICYKKDLVNNPNYAICKASKYIKVNKLEHEIHLTLYKNTVKLEIAEYSVAITLGDISNIRTIIYNFDKFNYLLNDIKNNYTDHCKMITVIRLFGIIRHQSDVVFDVLSNYEILNDCLKLTTTIGFGPTFRNSIYDYITNYDTKYSKTITSYIDNIDKYYSGKYNKDDLYNLRLYIAALNDLTILKDMNNMIRFTKKISDWTMYDTLLAANTINKNLDLFNKYGLKTIYLT